jgi:hypothetical protein
MNQTKTIGYGNTSKGFQNSNLCSTSHQNGVGNVDHYGELFMLIKYRVGFSTTLDPNERQKEEIDGVQNCEGHIFTMLLQS